MAFGGKIKRNKLDIVFSKLVRAIADHRCEACGRHEHEVKLECAHIIPRRYRATRWFLPNAVCLCHGCHRKFTEHPIAWVEWVQNHHGMLAYESLKRTAEKGAKFSKADLEDLYADLKEQLADLNERDAA